MRILSAAFACVLLLLSVAHADTARESRAKALFLDGRSAYERGDYQKAYDAFKESYLLSHEPALLYNISSALQGLKRPHEAAEALRSFIRLQPDDPDRAEMEKRIRTLEEEQRLLDSERRPAPPRPEVHEALMPSAMLTAPAPISDDAEKRHHKRVVTAVVVSVVVAVLAGTAIGLGVGLSQSKTEPYTPSTLGPLPGTR